MPWNSLLSTDTRSTMNSQATGTRKSLRSSRKAATLSVGGKSSKRAKVEESERVINDDPNDGEKHVGKRVAKFFVEEDGRREVKIFPGTVASYDKEYHRWRINYDDGDSEDMEQEGELVSAIALAKKNEEQLKPKKKERFDNVSKLVIFGHPGKEDDAFKGPKNANDGNVIDDPLNLELTLEDGSECRVKGSVFSTPRGDQRYLMQTKAHVISDGKKGGEKVETKLVRFAAEFAGPANEICRSKNTPANSLSKPWTRVYEPKLCPRFPVEAIIRDNDPIVLTGSEFRYGLCKQFSLRKMRTLPVGSIIIFCSMNNAECFLDTVFVVGKYADVIDEDAYQDAKLADDDVSPLDFCKLSRADFSDHQGADAWTAAIEQGSNKKDSLVTMEQAQTLKALQKDFMKRNPTPERLAVPPKEGSGPLSGRLYWGRSYDPDNSDGPFSFVPVWEVPKGKESSSEENLMRIRPKLDLKKLYSRFGRSDAAPKCNAQLTSKAVPLIDDSMQKECFNEILRQVKAQGYEIGIKFSPPSTMSPQLEKKLAALELGQITLCESSFGSEEKGIKKGRLITTEDRPDEIWEVISLRMGPFIRVKNQATGKIEEWPSIGTASNVIPARGCS